MSENRFPPGWDENRIKAVFEYYATQAEDESHTGSELGVDSSEKTVMEIPTALVPEIQEMIVRHKAYLAAVGTPNGSGVDHTRQSNHVSCQ